MSETKKRAFGAIRGEFIGAVVSEPITREVGNGTVTKYTSFRGKCTPFSKELEDLFVRVECANNNLGPTLKKGDEIVARGAVRLNSWKDDQGEVHTDMVFKVSREFDSLLVTKWAPRDKTESNKVNPTGVTVGETPASDLSTDSDCPF